MQKTALTARTEMLIRRPIADVFDAFVDPGKTSKFWFTGGSGRLEPASASSGAGTCTT
jgi:uncharacterized protein YndB with AHSA1/START domain